MEFLVADAERMFAENGKLQHLSFWSYKLLTRSYLPSYQQPPLFPSDHVPENYDKQSGYVDFCTWHRYSDFEWLAEHIQIEFPGILFPPIPSKEADGTVDKFTELLSSGKDGVDANKVCKDHPLVQRRIRQLQLTFNAIGQLREIHESSILKGFLTLDERDWCVFRDEQTAKNKASVMKNVKSKGMSLFNKLISFADSKEKILASSPIGNIYTQQKELVDLLHTCYVQVENMVKYSGAEIREWCDFDALCKRTQGAHLPWTACYCGHLVQNAQNSNMEGVVRYSKDDSAWVEWNGANGELERVQMDQLNYPSSGVSDPAVFAFQELAMQIESYCMQLSRQPQTEKLRELEHTLWFLSRYAHSCVRTIEHNQEVHREVQALTKSTQKKPKPDQLERLERLQQLSSSGTARILEQYKTFYEPYMHRALYEVTQAFGEASSALMSDMDWNDRLSRAEATLTLRFDMPPQVAQELAGTSPLSHADPTQPVSQAPEGSSRWEGHAKEAKEGSVDWKTKGHGGLSDTEKVGIAAIPRRAASVDKDDSASPTEDSSNAGEGRKVAIAELYS